MLASYVLVKMPVLWLAVNQIAYSWHAIKGANKIRR
jgi:hypothetical protein